MKHDKLNSTTLLQNVSQKSILRFHLITTADLINLLFKTHMAFKNNNIRVFLHL